MSSRPMRYPLDGSPWSAALQQCDHDYGRTLAEIMFDHTRAERGQRPVEAHLTEPEVARLVAIAYRVGREHGAIAQRTGGRP